MNYLLLTREGAYSKGNFMEHVLEKLQGHQRKQELGKDKNKD